MMDNLQDALQSILSDPEQMARIQAMAGALGLDPPEQAAAPREAPQEADGQLLSLLQSLNGLHGTEERVLGALRPGMSAQGQKRVDRALRAAKLSRLAGVFLNSGAGHV